MIRTRLLLAMGASSLLWALPQTGIAQDPYPVPPPPLKPGQSAGIQTAQQSHIGLALIGTGAIIAVVIVAATTSSGGSSNNQLNSQFVPVTTTP